MEKPQKTHVPQPHWVLFLSTMRRGNLREELNMEINITCWIVILNCPGVHSEVFTTVVKPGYLSQHILHVSFVWPYFCHVSHQQGLHFGLQKNLRRWEASEILKTATKARAKSVISTYFSILVKMVGWLHECEYSVQWAYKSHFYSVLKKMLWVFSLLIM